MTSLSTNPTSTNHHKFNIGDQVRITSRRWSDIHGQEGRIDGISFTDKDGMITATRGNAWNSDIGGYQKNNVLYKIWIFKNRDHWGFYEEEISPARNHKWI